MRFGIVVLLASGVLGMLPAFAGGDPAAGRAAFGVCEACHGVQGEGNRELGAPRIAGMQSWYFRRQIAAFRRGLRGAHPDDAAGRQMRPMAALLTGEATLSDVAAYLATLSPPAPAATVAGDIERGRALYAQCAPCHGADAGGDPQLGAPSLRGRDDWYLLRQLGNFRSGLRGTAEGDVAGAQMRAISLALRDWTALSDVVAYLRTLALSE